MIPGFNKGRNVTKAKTYLERSSPRLGSPRAALPLLQLRQRQHAIAPPVSGYILSWSTNSAARLVRHPILRSGLTTPAQRLGQQRTRVLHEIAVKTCKSNQEISSYGAKETTPVLTGSRAITLPLASKLRVSSHKPMAGSKPHQNPSGSGHVARFLVCSQRHRLRRWPTCGEIDIMENTGKEPATVQGQSTAQHDWPTSDATALFGLPPAKVSPGTFISTPSSGNKHRPLLRGYHPVRYLHAISVATGGTWVFNHLFFLILNVAVGGDWPGSPTAHRLPPANARRLRPRLHEAVAGTSR